MDRMLQATARAEDQHYWFRGLRRTADRLPPEIRPLQFGGEIQLTDAMAKLIGVQPFHGFTFDGVRHDCGDKLGWLQANIALGFERDDIGEAARAYARGLLG